MRDMDLFPDELDLDSPAGQGGEDDDFSTLVTIRCRDVDIDVGVAIQSDTFIISFAVPLKNLETMSGIISADVIAAIDSAVKAKLRAR